MIWEFAWKNFRRQGLRAFLNVLVTALTLVAIVFNVSLLNGFQSQTTRNMVKTDVGGGHYRVPGFDLLTPTEWEDHTRQRPEPLHRLPHADKAEVLVLQGQIFPNNRLYPVQLRGMEMKQTLLDLPLQGLRAWPVTAGDVLPATLGLKMARRAHLRQGDTLVMKWRDRFGAVDAREIKIVDVVHFINPRIDEGIVWLRLDHLRQITHRPGEVSWVAVQRFQGPMPGFEFKTVDQLMADLLALLKNDRRHALILWFILMFLSGISVLNTQLLNVFKRQKEIGSLMALGMDAGKIVRMFTLEGGMAAFAAVAAALVIGVPLVAWFQSVGLDISHLKESTLPVQENIFLDIKPAEVIGSVIWVVGTMILISWLPVRKIARLDPTQALRGRAIK